MSIGFSQVQAGIFAKFGAAYPTGWNRATWPVAPENVSWSLADHGAAVQPTDKAWGRLCVRFASSKNTSVDAKARRITGIVWLQIFLIEGKGSLEARKMGDEMERLFGEKTLIASGETIRFERAETDHVGKTPYGWEQHRCTVAFISDAVTL